MLKETIAIGPVLPQSIGQALQSALIDKKYQFLVEQLDLLIGIKVTGIIVYGSMVKNAPPKIGETDIDLLVLIDEEESGGIFGQVENMEIDLHIQSRKRSLDDIANNWVYCSGEVWFDLHPPELTNWLKRINMHMIQNPNPWTKVDELRPREWAYRLINKIVRVGHNNPTEAALHEARLIAAIPMMYKMSKKSYKTSIGNWWDELSKDDKDFAKEVTAYIAERTYPLDGVGLQHLIDKIFKNI